MKTKKPSIARRGMASLEALLTAAITLPMAAFTLRLLSKMLEAFFYLIGTAVGSPYT